MPGKHFRLAMVVVLLCSAESFAGPALPTSHPIFGLKDILGSQEAEIVAKKAEATVYSGSVHFPKWKITLPKHKFSVGEPIVATLRIQNNDKRYSYKFSPPFTGSRVATVGLWARTANSTQPGHWGELREVIPLNGGPIYSPIGGRKPALPGRPIVLPPKSSLTTHLLLNVVQYPAVPGETGNRWLSGVGLDKPGKYQLFIKYVNLEGLAPFGNSYMQGNDRLRKRLSQLSVKSTIIPLPWRKPVVLGPFEVEIVPRKSSAVNRHLSKLLAGWNKIKGQASDVIGLVDDQKPINALLKLLPADQRDLALSLSLTKLRAEMEDRETLAKMPKDVRKQKLQKLLDETKRLERQVPKGAVHDALLFTKCVILHALGQQRQAIALAKKVDSPDTKVLLFEWRRHK